MWLDELDKQEFKALQNRALSCEQTIRARLESLQITLKILSDAICRSLFRNEDILIYDALKYQLNLPKWPEKYNKDRFLSSQKSLKLFTDDILESPLGITFEDDCFIFKRTKDLKPEIAYKMHQFALSMSIFRIAVGLTKIYDQVLCHSFTRLNEYELQPDASLMLIKQCEVILEEEREKPDALEKITATCLCAQKELKHLERQTKDELKQFEHLLQYAVSVCGQALGKAKSLLINTYNTTKTGDEWPGMLLKFAQSLFPKHCSLSLYFMGELSISDDYYILLAKELMGYSLAMQQFVYIRKRLYLKEAEQLLSQYLEQKGALQTETTKPDVLSYSCPHIKPNSENPSSAHSELFLIKPRKLDSNRCESQGETELKLSQLQ